MRLLKGLVLMSASIFLLAVSWVLITGQVGEVAPAHAQSGGMFVSLVYTDYPGSGTSAVWGLTDTGDLYRMILGGSQVNQIEPAVYVGTFAGGSVIPSSKESMGNLKGQYHGEDQ